PTTILCEQHYINFKERFKQFGITVDYLSRFKSKKEINETLKALEEGRVDIVIGTHLLLSPKVRFKDLGLLIIDEEHRFGVAQKEKLKELKKDVDCLSLSATPIPRTLEMALSGLRPVSVLESPPEERLAVKGTVTEYRPEVIKQAILQEIERGGQVFFVHNRVQDIGIWKERLQALLPELKIALAHGQMKEKDLEEVILGFMHGEYDLLVCTNIIGSGIDIPRVNTIIINEAHRMGLADLYQLKGRVGRSNLQAYAYFVIPPIESLSEDAKRRIAAIEELNYLGAGLHLAMRDLEIRGAGNLLGKEQSGHIHALGFDLYMKMLQEEIDLLQGRVYEALPEPEIDIRFSAYIPDDYIQDITQKVNIYRRFYQTNSEEDVDQLVEELKDRFGPLPEELQTYAEMMKLRCIARQMKIKAIVFLKDRVKVLLHKNSGVLPEKVMELLKDRDLRFSEEGFSFKLQGDGKALLCKTKDFLKALQAGLPTVSIHTPL
ncbi:MAG: DEAD/DEAH box helicase, partial [Nitrospirae bacterium]